MPMYKGKKHKMPMPGGMMMKDSEMKAMMPTGKPKKKSKGKGKKG